MRILIREALPEESKILTDISFAAKRYWNYPEEFFEIWKDELTITPRYIKENVVFVAEQKGEIAGYFSLVEVKKDFWAGKVFVKAGLWLEHIFILPKFIGKRIGSELIDYAKKICRKSGVRMLYIFSDPYAKGFYDKIGARYIQESPSSIAGRTVSLFELDI